MKSSVAVIVAASIVNSSTVIPLAVKVPVTVTPDDDVANFAELS